MANTFSATTPVNFPAITVCPGHPAAAISVFACVKETSLVTVAQCAAPIPIQISFVVVSHNCCIVNDPARQTPGSVPLQATSLNDELALRVNVTVLPPADEPIGAYVLVHYQGEMPIVEIDNSFTMDVGKLSEVIVHLQNYVYLNGSVEWDFHAMSSNSQLVPDPTAPGSYTMDMDITFADQLGVYVTTEFRAITPGVWIAEVGGLACLLLFLHRGLTLIIMMFLARNLPRSAPQASDSGTTELGGF